jgi:hypothetical protein
MDSLSRKISTLQPSRRHSVNAADFISISIQLTGAHRFQAFRRGVVAIAGKMRCVEIFLQLMLRDAARILWASPGSRAQFELFERI